MDKEFHVLREIRGLIASLTEGNRVLPSSRVGCAHQHRHIGIMVGAARPTKLNWVPRSLTWEGCEFLDAARNDTVWNKAMTTLKEKAVSVPFEIVKAVVIKTCKDLFGIS